MWVELRGWLRSQHGVDVFVGEAVDGGAGAGCEVWWLDPATWTRLAALIGAAHPGVQRITGHAEVEGTVAVVAEAVPGAWLRTVAAAPWPTDAILEAARQVGALLEWCDEDEGRAALAASVHASSLWLGADGTLRLCPLAALGEGETRPLALGLLLAELASGTRAATELADRLEVAADATNHQRAVNRFVSDIADEDLAGFIAALLAFYEDERPSVSQVVARIDAARVAASALVDLAADRCPSALPAGSDHSLASTRFGVDGDVPPGDPPEPAPEPHATSGPGHAPGPPRPAVGPGRASTRPFGIAHDLSTLDVVYGRRPPRRDPSEPERPPVALTVFDKDGETITPGELFAAPGTTAEDRYDLEGVLGVGGMGEVHVARDRKLHRSVALKVMTPSAAAQKGLAGRFLAEIQIMAQLDHPNVVPVYALEQTRSGTPAFAMKKVEGRTFEAYIEACRADPGAEGNDLDTRLEHFVRVCDAMAYSHDRGVIHRDIKPANLMVGAFNEVYVMDWGIARLVGGPDPGIEARIELVDDSRPQTRMGTVVGTPQYMSPEQANGDTEALTPASDQYSLGLVLFELATLRDATPREGDPWALIEGAQQGVRNPTPVSGPAAVPRDLAAIIDKATSVDAAARYPGITELADDVRRFIRGEEVSARPYTVPRRAWRWVQEHPIAVLVALALVLTTGTLGLLGQTVYTLQQRVVADAHEQVMTQLTSRVGREASAIDAALLGHRYVTQELADVAGAMLTLVDPREGPVHTRDALAAGAGPDLKQWAAYGNVPVTFDAPVHVLAPEVGLDGELEGDVRRLLPLLDTLRAPLLAEVDTEGWDEARIAAHLGTGDHAVAWSYVALSKGVLVNYPGTSAFSDDYDPRTRSWYRETLDQTTAAWGSPYVNDSGLGILLPCTAPIMAPGFAGVAGLDLRLDAVIEMMAIDEPGVLGTYLLDRTGSVVVDGDDRGKQLEGGLHGNQPLDLEVFDDAHVVEAVKTGRAFGHDDRDGVLVVYTRLPNLGWTYVVRIDPAAPATWRWSEE